MEKSEDCGFCKDKAREIQESREIQVIWMDWNANATLSNLLEQCYQQLHLENSTEQMRISLSCKQSFLYANVMLVE